MAKLPDFRDTDCYYFEACGKLRGVKRQEERSQKVARIRSAVGNAYVRLLTGGEPVGHLHVDVALKRFFPKSSPEVTTTRQVIEREVSQYYGKAIDVFVFGQFVTFVKDIPPGAGVVFAGPNAVVSTVNDTAIEVGGAHLVLRNEGFVRSIDWQIYKDDTVFVDVVGFCETIVSPTYLLDLFERLDKAFGVYILGRTSDASAQS